MLVALAILSFLLVNVGAQVQKCELDPLLRNVYTQFLTMYNSGLKWNEDLSKMALQMLTKTESVNKEAYTLKLQTSRTFVKYDVGNMEGKVLRALRGFAAQWSKVYDLGTGTQFGCNGVFKEGEQRNSLNIMCLFLSGK